MRPRLFGIAYRVLGSTTEADDVVQDTWIRWQGTDRSKVRDAAAFLATTTTRLAINVGQSARARHEISIGPWPVEPIDAGADPSLGAEQRDALELAVRALLEKLSPTERAVYVLREAFDYPYRQIAELLALSEVNARQQVTRARRRLAATDAARSTPPTSSVSSTRSLAAAQTGDIATLEHLLAADVAGCADVLRAAPGPRETVPPRCRRVAAQDRVTTRAARPVIERDPPGKWTTMTATATITMPSNLLRIADLTAAQLDALLDLADDMKNGPTWWTAARNSTAIAGLFDTPSTRTRVSFEVAAHRLGIHPILPRPDELPLGHGEPLTNGALMRACSAL